MDELKPIAWIHFTKKGGYWISPNKQYPKDQPLYLAPDLPKRKWFNLTEEEMLTVVTSCKFTDTYKYFRAIEAKLKEKNG